MPQARYIPPMSVVVRTLVIWLLALALPVQAVAASAMVWCGTFNGPSSVSPTALLAAPGLQAAVAADDDVPHPCAMHAARDAATAEGAADNATAAGCTVCAACCMGALLPTVPTPLWVGGSQPSAQATVVAVRQFAAHGPERPPRS